MNGWETGWGLDFLVYMNNLGGRTLDLLFEPFAFIGGEYGYTIMMPILFWAINDRLGRRLYALVMCNAMVNGFFKNMFGRPRPFQVAPDRITPFHTEGSFGLPSGHTQGGTVIGLFFADLAKKSWVKILMYVLIFLMGISRMVHGVHFLQDVLLGWVLGFIVFFLFIGFENRVLPGLKEKGTGLLILLSLLPAVLALVIEYTLQGKYPVTRSLLASGGALSGIFLGMIIEMKNGWYRSSGTVWKRILRIPIGLAVVMGVTLGTSEIYHAIFSDTPGVLGIAVYIIRYVLTGFAGYWLAPQLFIICRLAEKREKA